ncbi:hypothetical protein CsSME_00022692 [Camellia sinensis var. sinensis]
MTSIIVKAQALFRSTLPVSIMYFSLFVLPYMAEIFQQLQQPSLLLSPPSPRPKIGSDQDLFLGPVLLQELTLGLQAHSDMGAITLLIQDDVGGLQVLKDGEWVNVHPLSDAVVVILANLHAELDRACKDWGAFHVTNHGVPIQLLNEMRRVGVLFFEECPMAEKLRYCCDSNSFASEGYGSRLLVSSNDTALDWRDYFGHHTLPLSRRNPDRWPHFPPNYREVVAEYGDRMKVLAQRLLRLISESLGLPSSRIKEAVGEFYQNITVSYYPPCPQPELSL